MHKVAQFIKKFGLPALALLSPVSVLAVGLAQSPISAPGDVLNDQSQINSSVCDVINWLFYGLIIFSVIMVLLAAYGYLTSNGDPEKTGNAGKKLMYAAIAIVIAIIASAFPNLIGSFLGHGNIIKSCSYT